MKPRMMFYTDGRHPLMYMYEPPMQKEEMEAIVDELVGTPVEALMFCLGDGRTMLHDTKVGELWGHSVERWDHIIFRRAYQNARCLIDEGNDPLRVVCDRAHEKGMLVYPTLLVQLESGVRGGGGYDVRSSDFRLDNKHLDIGGSGTVDPSFPGLNCADFKHREVREERFAIVEEVLTRYDVDGFELQLNFWPYYFHPDEVDAGRAIMTDWIGRVHEAVKRSNPERELVVSIPASFEDCLSRGLDPIEWIRRGIVDVLIGQPLSRADILDPNATFLTYDAPYLSNLRGLVKAAAGSRCRVHAAIDSYLDSDRLAEAPIEMIRAAACNLWAQGIDGLYVSQWHGMWPYRASFYEKLRELPFPEVMAYKDKYYHIPTEAGRIRRIQGTPPRTSQLPADLQVGSPLRLDLEISDDVARWERTGRVHEVLLRVRVMNATELDRLKFILNGKELSANALRIINEMYRMGAQVARHRLGSGYWYIFRLDRSTWPRIGVNAIEITLLERDPEVTPVPCVHDVELQIKYLMGKHFHRGIVDPDLGPFDGSAP